MWTIGDVIRKLRNVQGLTIPELADEAGINQKTLSSIERDECDPTEHSMSALARALGVGSSAEDFTRKRMEWAEHLVGRGSLRPDCRVLCDYWMRLDADPEAQRYLLMMVRREVRQFPLRQAARALRVEPAPLDPPSLETPRRKRTPDERLARKQDQARARDHADEVARGARVATGDGASGHLLDDENYVAGSVTPDSPSRTPDAEPRTAATKR